MSTAPVAVVCVDWGSTNFRLWAFARDGSVRAERRAALGMTALVPADYEKVLETALAELAVARATPTLICGMAGAAHGWCESPYMDLPARLDELPTRAVRVPTAAREVRILPGLAQRARRTDARATNYDVMRGEETILLGAQREPSIHRVVCLPGTHCKWVEIGAKAAAKLDAGVVTRFRTAMTGEIFALLTQHSTLSPFVAAPRAAAADAQREEFSAAVREALQAPARILNALFALRAHGLLGGDRPADARDLLGARLSGLLIGLEIAGMRAEFAGPITLIADDALADNYRRALQLAEIEFTLLSARAMTRQGLLCAARAVWAEALN